MFIIDWNMKKKHNIFCVFQLLHFCCLLFVAVGSHFKVRRIDKAKVENGREGASTTMTGERR